MAEGWEEVLVQGLVLAVVEVRVAELGMAVDLL